MGAEDLAHPEIVALVEAFLMEPGSDFPASPGNVRAFLATLAEAVAAGDPVLMACDPNPVGFFAIRGIPTPGAALRAGMAIGLYVRPSHRRRGIARRLREVVCIQAAQCGYARLDEIAVTVDAHASATRCGWQPAGWLLHRDLGGE